jgi:hypothetical protein
MAIITHILIRNQKCRKSTLKKLEKIVESDHIKTNGNIAIKCNLDADVLTIRAKLIDLFGKIGRINIKSYDNSIKVNNNFEEV